MPFHQTHRDNLKSWTTSETKKTNWWEPRSSYYAIGFRRHTKTHFHRHAAYRRCGPQVLNSELCRPKTTRQTIRSYWDQKKMANLCQWYLFSGSQYINLMQYWQGRKNGTVERSKLTIRTQNWNFRKGALNFFSNNAIIECYQNHYHRDRPHQALD